MDFRFFCQRLVQLRSDPPKASKEEHSGIAKAGLPNQHSQNTERINVFPFQSACGTQGVLLRYVDVAVILGSGRSLYGRKQWRIDLS